MNGFHEMIPDKAEAIGLLRKAEAFLSDGAELFLPHARRNDLIRIVSLLISEAERVSERLFVGILGGTGVGKSTLINSLAGRQIAVSSAVRPRTGKALLYRRRGAPHGLEAPKTLLETPDAEHDVDSLKDLVLIDFPDFDGYKPEHHLVVHELAPKLDCIVWVVSPEKYADETFYEALKDSPVHPSNFTFVLNKVDQLISTDHGPANLSLRAVKEDFIRLLSENLGMESPVVFAISALQETEGAAEGRNYGDDFARFRGLLMRKRMDKEIASTKLSNLRLRISRFLTDLKAEIKSDRLRVAISEARKRRPELIPGNGPTGLELKGLQMRLVRSIRQALLTSEGPGVALRLAEAGLARLRSFGVSVAEPEPHRLMEELVDRMGDSRFSFAEQFAQAVEAELGFAMPTGAPAARPKGRHEMASEVVRVVEERLTIMVEAEKQQLVRKRAGLRRVWRKALFGVPVVLFFMKLLGAERFDTWIAEPGFVSALTCAVFAAASVFSSEGLCALLALLLCEALLFLWFSARTVKRLDVAADRTAQAIMENADAACRSTCERAVEEARERERRIEAALSRLETLEPFKEAPEFPQ